MTGKAYYSDEKIDDIHWEIQKEINKKKKDPIRNVPSGAMLFLIIAGIVVIFIAVTRNTDITKLVFMIAVIAGIVLFLSTKHTNQDILSEQDCKRELYYKLRYKQKNPLGRKHELPEGDIQIDVETRLRFYEGKPWKRYVGFKVITTSGLIEQYYAAQNPYDGDIIETKYCPEGFNPSDINDIVVIASPELQRERRWTEMGGKI